MVPLAGHCVQAGPATVRALSSDRASDCALWSNRVTDCDPNLGGATAFALTSDRPLVLLCCKARSLARLSVQMAPPAVSHS